MSNGKSTSVHAGAYFTGSGFIWSLWFERVMIISVGKRTLSKYLIK